MHTPDPQQRLSVEAIKNSIQDYLINPHAIRGPELPAGCDL